MGRAGGKNCKPCKPNPCKPARPPRSCRRGEAELFGIILVILGAVTIGAFLLPSKLWLILLGAVMILLGVRLIL